jgi:hypothetical protein
MTLRAPPLLFNGAVALIHRQNFPLVARGGVVSRLTEQWGPRHMRHFLPILVLGILAAHMHAARAANLDTPVKTTPTIGSEIRRGFLAASDCSSPAKIRDDEQRSCLAV